MNYRYLIEKMAAKELDIGKTIVFDFDGVIHSYVSGWKGIDVIPDEPVEGIGEVIKDLRNDGYQIVVVSSRCTEEKGIKAIKEYLDKYNIVVDDVRKEKVPAIAYVDDNAIHFKPSDVDTLASKIKAIDKKANEILLCMKK